MVNPLLMTTALLGAIAVGMGALGGHAMQTVLTDSQLQTWETATRYLMWHVLAALVFASLRPSLKSVAWLWLLGGALFAGSLYGWLLLQWRPLVMITPMGGVIMIAGWLWLFIQAGRGRSIHD